MIKSHVLLVDDDAADISCEIQKHLDVYCRGVSLDTMKTKLGENVWSDSFLIVFDACHGNCIELARLASGNKSLAGRFVVMVAKDVASVKAPVYGDNFYVSMCDLPHRKYLHRKTKTEEIMDWVQATAPKLGLTASTKKPIEYHLLGEETRGEVRKLMLTISSNMEDMSVIWSVIWNRLQNTDKIHTEVRECLREFHRLSIGYLHNLNQKTCEIKLYSEGEFISKTSKTKPSFFKEDIDIMHAPNLLIQAAANIVRNIDTYLNENPKPNCESGDRVCKLLDDITKLTKEFTREIAKLDIAKAS